MLAAFIGVDGSGKTTQFRKLAMIYANRGIDVGAVALTDKASMQAVLRAAETLGEAPFELTNGAAVSASVLANALATDFLRHYVANILPLLASKTLILSDRYALCYDAYAYALGAPADGLYAALERICVPPDVTFWFDLSYDVVETRIAERNEERSPDETPRILKALIDYYRRTLGPNKRSSLIRVPAELPLDDVTALVQSTLDTRLQELGIRS